MAPLLGGRTVGGCPLPFPFLVYISLFLHYNKWACSIRLWFLELQNNVAPPVWWFGGTIGKKTQDLPFFPYFLFLPYNSCRLWMKLFIRITNNSGVLIYLALMFKTVQLTVTWKDHVRLPPKHLFLVRILFVTCTICYAMRSEVKGH